MMRGGLLNENIDGEAFSPGRTSGSRPGPSRARILIDDLDGAPVDDIDPSVNAGQLPSR